MTRHNTDDRRDSVYRRDVRLAAVSALTMVIAAFVLVKQSEVRPYQLRAGGQSPVILIDNPITIKLPEPPPVVRPKQLVADPMGKATDPSVGQHNWKDTGATRHAPPPLEPVPWSKLEVKPQQVYLEVPEYPEMARQAGIEGRVTLKALVDTIGGVVNVEILRSSGNTLLDEAATGAVWKCRFTPGYQNHRPVLVWVAIPFDFRLH